jgi:hypothetical protein
MSAMRQYAQAAVHVGLRTVVRSLIYEREGRFAEYVIEDFEDDLERQDSDEQRADCCRRWMRTLGGQR